MSLKMMVVCSFSVASLLWAGLLHAQAKPEPEEDLSQSSWTSGRVTGLMLDFGLLSDDRIYGAFFSLELSHQRPSGLLAEVGIGVLQLINYNQANQPLSQSIVGRVGYAQLVKGQLHEPWRGYLVPLVGYRVILDRRQTVQMIQGGLALDVYEGGDSLFTFRTYGFLDYELEGYTTGLGLNMGVSLGISL